MQSTLVSQNSIYGTVKNQYHKMKSHPRHKMGRLFSLLGTGKKITLCSSRYHTLLLSLTGVMQVSGPWQDTLIASLGEPSLGSIQ